jgi:hypothetical protein
MLNNNHKNKDCEYGEALVSYLYGEANAGERAALEAHLDDCAACAGELEAFSGVHFSINDWKAMEFDRLETPFIEIPYEKAEKRVESSVAASSWIAELRGFFSLSPVWSLATASLAVAAVAVGLIFYAARSPKLNEVTHTSLQTQISPTPSSNVNQNSSPDKVVKPIKEPESPKPETVVDTKQKKSSVVKTTTNQRQPRNAETTNTQKNKDVKDNKNNNRVPPGVIQDEEEDNTLRLAEIFDEIDTDE